MKLNKNAAPQSAADQIEEGTHIARLVQLAHVGNQPAFDEGKPALDSLTAVFQTEDGKQIASTFKLSLHPSSRCYALIGHLEADEAGDIDVPAAVGECYAIDVALKEGKWSRLETVAPLEPFQDPIPEVEGCLWFDADDMPSREAAAEMTPEERKALNETFMQLHKEIRQKLQTRVEVSQ